MGDRPGGLLFSTTGERVASYGDLPDFMQQDIKERLPLFADAPPCVLDVDSSTSWTYFRDNFDAYLSGKQFPIEAPNASEPCKFAPAVASSS